MMGRRLILLFLIFCLLAAAPLLAHEMRPAYLQITETEPGTYDVMWKVPARGDMRLSLYVRFAEDVEIVGQPVAGMSGGAYIERWRVRRPGGLAGTPVVIDGLAATYTDALARVSLLNIEPQSILLKPEKPSFVIAADPSGWEVAGTYFRLGVEHILLGIDHLLFVLGLLILSRGLVLLVKTITAFTVGHSISLALATFGVVNVPGPPLSAAIALSIVFLAAELVRRDRGGTSLTIRNPWLVSLGFGMLHGLGFAGALVALGLPQTAIPLALLLFNLGVEAGQILFVVTVLVVLSSFRKLDLSLPPWAKPLPVYAMGSVAAYWFWGRAVLLF
jgi:HupE / UreJ protein